MFVTNYQQGDSVTSLVVYNTSIVNKPHALLFLLMLLPLHKVKRGNVKYFIYTNGYHFGITPLYNADGTLQVYDGE